MCIKINNEQYEEIINSCRFCLMCRHMCTVGNINYRETNHPRGRALILDCIGTEALEGTKENYSHLLEVFYECAYCGQCQNNCVSDYANPYMGIKARAKFGNEYPNLLPEIVKETRNNLKNNGNVYGKSLDIKLKNAMPNKNNCDVLIYMGSTIRNKKQELADMAINICKKAGLESTYLSEEKDSGYLAYMFGLPEVAEELSKSFSEKIDSLNPDILVTLNAADYRAFSDDIIDFPKTEINSKILTMPEFLSKIIKEKRLVLKSKKEKVTYHDSCQLGRFLEDYSTPRQIINNLPEVQFEELFWNKGEASCCGAGGGLEITNESLANEIRDKRVKEIKELDIDTVVTDCPLCKEYLEKGLSKIKVKLLHEMVFNRLA